MSLGTPELLLIFVLILMLFGPHRLPELARGLGKGLREFKKVTSEFQNQLSSLADDDDASSTSRRESRRDAASHASSDEDPEVDYSSPYDSYNTDPVPGAPDEANPASSAPADTAAPYAVAPDDQASDTPSHTTQPPG